MIRTAVAARETVASGISRRSGCFALVDFSRCKVLALNFAVEIPCLRTAAMTG